MRKSLVFELKSDGWRNGKRFQSHLKIQYDKNTNEMYKDLKKHEYHAGYKQGYCDACEDRYWYGWYSGLMMGTLIGGVLMYIVDKKSRFTLF